MIIKIVLFILIVLMSYSIGEKIIENFSYSKIKNYVLDKNEKYYNSMLKEYEKNKKIKNSKNRNIVKTIGIQIERAGLDGMILINPITVIIVSAVVWTAVYIITFNFFRQVNLSVIVSAPTALIPIAIINFIGNAKQEKIEKVLLNFLLQLKNSTQINNDIVSAFREVKKLDY